MTLRKSGWGGGGIMMLGGGGGIMMLAQPYYGSFPLSGTVRYSTVRNYLRFHSEVVKGTKIANRTTLLVPFRWGT